MISDHDDDVSGRRDLDWPDEALVIRELLSDESHQPRDTDAIAAHYNRLHLTIGVLILEAEHIREPRSQLEYIRRLRHDPTITDRMSTLDTDECCFIDDLLIVSLLTIATHKYLIFTDRDLGLELV